MGDKRQQGGRAKVELVWQHGADLTLTRSGCKTQRYWLCQICHVNGVRRSTFHSVSGYTLVNHRLITAHHIRANGKQLPKIEKQHSPFELPGSHLSNRDFSKQQQDFLLYTYPDWVIQQNLSF